MPSLIDITRPLINGIPVWPGDEPFETSWSARIADGDTCNVGRVQMSLHCGTHIDAPYHILEDGNRIAAAEKDLVGDLTPFVGDALVVSAPNTPIVSADVLRSQLVPGLERILIRTDSNPVGSFNRGYTWLSSEAARLLVESGIVLVGIDTPSVDAFDSEYLETHRTLASAGIVIVEGLELSTVSKGMYELVVLPLRLVGMDASPARAILRAR